MATRWRCFAGEAYAALAELGVEAIRPGAGEFGDVGCIARGAYVGVARIRVAIAHVVGDAAGENHRLCETSAKRSRCVEVSGFDVNAVHRHHARLRSLKAQQQPENTCSLPAPRADQGDNFTGLDRK